MTRIKTASKHYKVYVLRDGHVRLYAAKAMLENFKTVIKCSDIISLEHQESADSIINKFTVCNVLKIINSVQIIFQKIDIDILLALKSIEYALNKLK